MDMIFNFSIELFNFSIDPLDVLTWILIAKNVEPSDEDHNKKSKP